MERKCGMNGALELQTLSPTFTIPTEDPTGSACKKKKTLD